MSNLRCTETNAGDDTSGRAFGLEGDNYLPVVSCLVFAIAGFSGLAYAGVRLGLAGALAALPLVVCLAWLIGLRRGRPPGHDRDVVEQWLGGGDFPFGTAKADTLAHTDPPDGRFVDGMLVFGSPLTGAFAAKGFRLGWPDLRGASHERLNAGQDQLQAMLALLGPGRRLQVQWWIDADYRQPLLDYRAATEGVRDAHTRSVRNERFTRYWQRMAAGTLRREHLVVFLSLPVAGGGFGLAGRAGLLDRCATVLRQAAAEFDEFEGALRNALGSETAVEALGDLEHFTLIRRFLNPSLTRRSEEDPSQLFDPERSLQENCWHSDGIGQPNGGFHLDGHYHAILALSRWPQRTRPGIVGHLTGLPFLDYRVTVNVVPVPGREEVTREEKSAERLRGEYAEKPRASLLVALRKKERKVESLAGGFARPFRVTYLIRVWAPSPEALREKVSAVQAAVNAMDGAQTIECALPTTARKLFFASWPGWTMSSYRHRELYAEDAYLADVLPFSATFTGDLATAEAIYDGSHGNLVGVATAVRGSPQHAVILGMTGAGKSAFVEDLLFQTAGFFAHTLLVEEGLSYRKFTEAMGEQTIVVHPDSDLTINYFDTQGLPLTQLHIASVVALLVRMVGETGQSDRAALRQAQLTQYLHLLYRDTFTDWAGRHPARAEELTRFACAAHQWRRRMPAGATPVEAFLDLRDRKAANEEAALAFIAGLTEETVTRFTQEPATARLVEQAACAYYARDEFPIHAALVEMLTYAQLPDHDREEINRFATLLSAWTAEGQYGKLFDGATNVSLQRRVAHFELGLIPEQAVELKTAAGLLIGGFGRQHILGLPRAARKRILFEELARFLDTPGGEQIVAEGYAQLRKHNCWCASVVQQYSRFRHSRVRAAVIGNAKQVFLMRQSDRAELTDLAKDLAISETALDAIQRYPLPEQLTDKTRHSSVCYFTPTSHPPLCGTIRHFQEASCEASS